MTAFAIFTEEYDQWWGRDPIDAYDTWRLVERRIEGGVGGRLVEDYGDEQLVLGRITIWEPGARLAWKTRNDVTIDVTFEAYATGARVRVIGKVPDGIDGGERALSAEGPQPQRGAQPESQCPQLEPGRKRAQRSRQIPSLEQGPPTSNG